MAWLGTMDRTQHHGSRPPRRFRFIRPLVVLSLLALTAHASAQPGATLNRFGASETPEDDFAMSRPTDLGHLRFGGQVHLDYANDPLVFESMLGDRDSERLSVVEHQMNLTAGLALGVWDRLVVYGALPIVALMEGDSDPELGGVAADGAGLGDLVLGARVRLLGERDDIGALALQAGLLLPTGGGRFRGDESVSVHPELVGELRPLGALRFVMNLGARIRDNPETNALNLRFGDELTFGVGAVFTAWSSDDDPETHFDLHLQGYGSSAFQDFFERDATAFEIVGGAKLFHATGLVVGAAGGPGLVRGFGGPDVRLIATLGYRTPANVVTDRDGDGIVDDDDRCPDDAEDVDAFEDEDGCPDPDNDQDGVVDVEDACPLNPEDLDQFEDADGCPEPDNDGDGLDDVDDSCPLEAEDVDDHEDADGCPDPDNDADGVLDADDRCPNEAGPVDNEGCPEEDRDGDGVPDRLDNCPDEPGPAENQGCQAEQQVRITDDRIEILEIVYFRTNRAVIQPRSFGLLENVARVLNAHPRDRTHPRRGPHRLSRAS